MKFVWIRNILGKGHTSISLPNNRMISMSKFKPFADNNWVVAKMANIVCNSKHWGKKRKCCSPAFSPFHTMFSKALFLRVVKSRGCMGKTWPQDCLMKDEVIHGITNLDIHVDVVCQSAYCLNPFPNDKIMVGWLYWGLTPLWQLKSYHGGRRPTCVSWLSHTSTNTTYFPKPLTTFLTCFSRGER